MTRLLVEPFGRALASTLSWLLSDVPFWETTQLAHGRVRRFHVPPCGLMDVVTNLWPSKQGIHLGLSPNLNTDWCPFAFPRHNQITSPLRFWRDTFVQAEDSAQVTSGCRESQLEQSEGAFAPGHQWMDKQFAPEKPGEPPLFVSGEIIRGLLRWGKTSSISTTNVLAQDSI